MSNDAPNPQQQQTVRRSRALENWMAVAALVLAALYVLGVEIFPHVAYTTGWADNPPASQEFPWGVVTIQAILLAPKVLGRATAGQVWLKIADKLPGK